MSDFGTFDVDFAKGIQLLSQLVDNAAAKVILAVGSDIINETPVGPLLKYSHGGKIHHPGFPGALQQSWYSGVNGPPGGSFGGNENPVGELAQVVSDLNPGDVVTMENVAPYVLMEEFGGSGARGKAFIQSVLARADQIAARVLIGEVASDAISSAASSVGDQLLLPPPATQGSLTNDSNTITLGPGDYTSTTPAGYLPPPTLYLPAPTG